ncbi:MAG TPA: hypothetical protein VLI54_03380 [Bacillota bacterium]|nr:hypothetical protein [Bacillota bacterium]
MTDISVPSGIEFGLYMPVIDEDRARLERATQMAAGFVQGYLGERGLSGSVEISDDFGVLFATAEHTGRRLATAQASDFTLAGFVENVNTVMRPLELPTLTVPVSKNDALTIRVSGFGDTPTRQVSAMLTFDHATPGAATLRRQYALARRAFDEAGGGRIDVGQRIEGMSLMRVKASEGVFTPEDRNKIQWAVRLPILHFGIGEVTFGRMVIGTGPRQPLPGTEWPPANLVAIRE